MADESTIDFDRNAARITALERLYEQRFIDNAKARDLALAANNARLDGMNEFRNSLNDTTNKMMTRVEALTVLESASNKTNADVAVLRDKLEESLRPNYPFIIGLLTVAATVLAGVWLIIGLKIEATITPNGMSIVSLQEHSRQMDTQLASIDKMANDSSQSDLVSKSDRAQLGARLSAIESQFAVGSADRRGKEEGMRQKLVEIETQFCASDIVRNLLHATDMRVQAMLWSKVFPDVRLPTDNTFYAKVCNRNTEQ